MAGNPPHHGYMITYFTRVQAHATSPRYDRGGWNRPAGTRSGSASGDRNPSTGIKSRERGEAGYLNSYIEKEGKTGGGSRERREGIDQSHRSWYGRLRILYIYMLYNVPWYYLVLPYHLLLLPPPMSFCSPVRISTFLNWISPTSK